MMYITLILLSLAMFLVGGFYFFQRQSLVTDVYSHLAFPGVLLSYLIFNSLDLFYIILFTVFFIWLFDILKRHLFAFSKFNSDSLFAFFISFGFAMGTVLLNVLQNKGVSTKLGFDTFLFGNIASLSLLDSIVISCLSLLVLITLFVCRRFCFNISFLGNSFETQSKTYSRLKMFLKFLSILLCVLSLKVAGVVLTTGLFLIPFAIVSSFNLDLYELFFYGLTLILFVSWVCLYLSSSVSGLATGPLLISIYFVVYLFSRGIVFLKEVKHG